MLAVVKINGTQFKVSKNSVVYAPFIDAKEGDTLEFKDIILFENNGTVDAQNVNKTVQAEVLKQMQGEKVIAFKMKRRKGFRKKKGHRTQLTQLLIKDIV